MQSETAALVGIILYSTTSMYRPTLYNRQCAAPVDGCTGRDMSECSANNVTDEND